jgi:hypothetical protein
MTQGRALTVEQAYRAMYRFLEVYQQETQSHEVGSMLGEFRMASGPGDTSDPGAWSSWLKAVDYVLTGQHERTNR